MIGRFFAWLALRFRKHPPMDRRWERHVDAAEADRRRFNDAVTSISDPTIREALAGIGTELSTAVDTVRSVATRGQDLQNALARLPNRSFLEHQLNNLVARGLGDDDSRVQAARYQLATIDRVRGLVADTQDRLEEIDADLDVSVVRAVEAGVDSSTAPDLIDLRESIERSVSELEALNLAIIEVGEIG